METITAVSASDVNKLRLRTGLGMMDCKKALSEAGGDFEKAIELLRKKGEKVAANRGAREAKEGYVAAVVSGDKKFGVIVSLNCETDFVAKNEGFMQLASAIAELALKSRAESPDALKKQKLNTLTVEEAITGLMGRIGEKVELARYEFVHAARVFAYIHPGNKIVSIVGLNKESANRLDEVGKEIAMQVAAMNPIAIDKGDVDRKTVEKEIEIAKEQARAEGKPENILEKIAIGKLNKFYQDYTLLNQCFIREEKKTVAQYLNETEKGLTVTGFKRVSLKD